MSVQAMPGTNPHPLRAEVRALLQAAMAVFTFTVVIGILNGTDLVDFDRKRILAHVHGGTLGWITMSVFAASLWLFGQGELTPGMRRAARALTVFAIVALPVFAFTFAFTYGEARPIIGSFALAAIIGFFAWVTIRARCMTLSVVHIGFLAAVATSVAGGVLGVLLATKIATGREVLPDGGADAHPATMVVGFLIPVGMALAEWCFHWEKLKPAGRGGFLQIALPFLGGMLLFGVGAYRIAKMGKLALKLHQDSKAEKERLKKEEELKNPKVPPLKVIGYFLLCLLGVLLLALVSNVIHNGGRLG